MGAIKAGVSVVTFDEVDETEALGQALSDSGARGLIFTPNGGSSRLEKLQELMPELADMRAGC